MTRFLLSSLLAAAASSVSARWCPPMSAYPSLSGNVSISDAAYYQFRAAASGQVSWPGAGGLGGYGSFALHGAASPASSNVYVDAIGAQLTAATGAPPTASLAWFSTSAAYNFNISSSSASANVYAGAYTSAMSTIFLDVFEYDDNNNNGIYDEGVDKQGKKIPLMQGNVIYDAMCMSASDDSPLVIFNSTTVEPSIIYPLLSPLKFSIQTTMSKVVGVLSTGAVITPRGMKIDLSVSGFPYSDANGQKKLAMTAVVASAQANASVAAAINGDLVTSGTGDSQLSFSWDNVATVDGNSAAVKSSGFVKFIDSNSELGLAADIFFGIGAGASVDLKKIYFSFDAVQPSSVYWDPSIISGPLPITSAFSSSVNGVALGIGITVGLLGLIVAIYFAYKLHMKRQQQGQTMKNEREALVDNSVYVRTNEL